MNFREITEILKNGRMFIGNGLGNIFMNKRNTLAIIMLLSKVDNKFHIALDGNLKEIEEFGLSQNKLNLLMDNIEKLLNEGQFNG